MKRLFSFFTLSLFLVSAGFLNAQTTWTQQDNGTMQGIRGLVGDEEAMIAAGNTGNVMRSTDSGETWELLPSTSNVWWVDASVKANGNFVLVGNSGSYTESEDAGQTWTSSNLGSSSDFYDFDQASTNTGYVVGSDATVLYYVNGNWHTGAPDITESLYAVQDNGDGTAWIVGGAGRLIAASNSGITWTNYGRIADDNLWDVYFSDGSNGWVVGENGTFKNTTDGAVSWSDVEVEGLSDQNLYDMDIAEDLMVVSGEGIVLMSEDAGQTWSSTEFSDGIETMYVAYVQDASNAWVAGTDFDVWSRIYHYEVVVEESVTEETEQEEQEQTPEAETGNLIKMTCDTDVDVNDPCKAVYYYADDGKRHAFPNENVFFTWFEDFDGVIEVSYDFMSDITLGSNVTYHPGTKMVKFQSVPTVYAVEQSGVLRAIASEDIAKALYGEDWNQQIDDISDAFIGNYSFGEDIDSSDDYDPDDWESYLLSLDDNF